MKDLCNSKSNDVSYIDFFYKLFVCSDRNLLISILNDQVKKENLYKILNNDSPFYAFSVLLDDKELSLKKVFDLISENKIFVKDDLIEVHEHGKTVLLPKMTVFKNKPILKGEFVVEDRQLIEKENIYVFSNKNYLKYNKNVLLFVRLLRLLNYKFFDFNYLVTEEGELLLPITSLESLFLLTESPYHMYLKFSSYGNYYENYFIKETVKLFIALLLSGFSKTNPNNFLTNKVTNTLLYLENKEEDSYNEVELLDKYTFSDEVALANNLGFLKKPETVKPSKLIKSISEEIVELSFLPIAKVSEEILKIINIPTIKLLYKMVDLNINNIIINRLFVLRNIYT